MFSELGNSMVLSTKYGGYGYQDTDYENSPLEFERNSNDQDAYESND